MKSIEYMKQKEVKYKAYDEGNKPNVNSGKLPLKHSDLSQHKMRWILPIIEYSK